MNTTGHNKPPKEDLDIIMDSQDTAERLERTLVKICGCEPQISEDEVNEVIPGREPTKKQKASRADAEEMKKFLQGLHLEEWNGDSNKFKIYENLKIMPHCVDVMRKRRGDSKKNGNWDKPGTVKPLKDVVIITIHHLDDKALAAHAVMREWGATDMTGLWVGYNPLWNEIWTPQLKKMGIDKFRSCVFSKEKRKDATQFAERRYKMVRHFTLFPKGEMSEALQNEFDRRFEEAKPGHPREHMTFMEAMRSLTFYVFLHTVGRVLEKQRTSNPNTRLLIYEDGGYLHPEISRACVNGLTVKEVREKYSVPFPDEAWCLKKYSIPDKNGVNGEDRKLADILKNVFIGTTEWTRNGYNRSVRAQRDHNGMLSHPLFSTAVSHVKADIEGDTIAVACQTALTMALYSIGESIRRRHVLLMGARGNIGRYSAHHFADILENPTEQLLCCDLKVGRMDPDNVPLWTDKPSKPIIECRTSRNGDATHPPKCECIEIMEKMRYIDFSKAQRKKIDLVFGWTGGKEQTRKGTNEGEDVFEPRDMQEWLIDGEPMVLYLASGSTKAAEFRAILDWLDEMIVKMNPKNKNKKAVYIQYSDKRRRLISLTSRNFEDGRVKSILEKPAKALGSALSNRVFEVAEFLKKYGRSFGTIFEFTIASDKGSNESVKKEVYLLFFGKPINFMFHGTPAEVLDQSYAQLTDLTAMLGMIYHKAPEKLVNPKTKLSEIFATDYKTIATDKIIPGVDAIVDPADSPLGNDFPVPDVEGFPLITASDE